MDLVRNSIQAGADQIELDIGENDRSVSVVVTDNGPGMDEETRLRALDPFYSDGRAHPDRRVGLGLPFVRQIAEATGGRFLLESAVGRGTRVELEIPAAHPDAPPFSDPAGCFATLLAMGGPEELVIRRATGAVSYELRRSELVDALGELESVGSQVLLLEYISSQEGTHR